MAQASASFTEGKKLVYAEVQPIEELMDASYAYVLDFAGAAHGYAGLAERAGQI